MTISTTTTRVAYDGDGATTAFAVPFPFFGAGELEVLERDTAAGSEALRVLGTHYTVAGGDGAAGTVTASSPPSAPVQWVIRRKTARTQATDYTPNDPFPADTHEKALDRLTLIGQELGEESDRSLKFPKTDAEGLAPTLPASVARANRVLAFDGAGVPVASTLTLAALEAGTTAAAASATAAAASATGAAASATAAVTSAANAAASEAAAAASAAGVNLPAITLADAGKGLVVNEAGDGYDASPVDTAGIADNAVTVGKIEQLPAETLLGNNTDATANAKKLTIAQLAAMLAPRGYIDGLTLSNDGTSPNTVLDIAAGVAMSDDNTAVMSLAAFTKTTGAWAVGSGNGGLDTGTIAINTWYHVYVIKRLDTGVVDVLLSTSVSAPTMPANYTVKRRIGSINTDGSGHITGFTQQGDEFRWKSSILNVNANNPGTSAVLVALSVAPGVPTVAMANWFLITADTTNETIAYVSDPASTDEAPNNTGVPLGNIGPIVDTAGNTDKESRYLQIRTDTSQRVRYRLSFSSTDVTIRAATLGWIDRRGKDA